MKQTDWQTWSVIATWQVAPEHPALTGHFPGHPVVPGALLLDRAVRAAERHAGRTVAQVREARFQRAVAPGAVLELRLLAAPSSVRFALAEAAPAPAALVASGTLILDGAR